MSTFSFPFPITVVALSGATGGTRETDMKLQPEAKNRHRPKMQAEIVKKYLSFIFSMMRDKSRATMMTKVWDFFQALFNIAGLYNRYKLDIKSQVLAGQGMVCV